MTRRARSEAAVGRRGMGLVGFAEHVAAPTAQAGETQAGRCRRLIGLLRVDRTDLLRVARGLASELDAAQNRSPEGGADGSIGLELYAALRRVSAAAEALRFALAQDEVTRFSAAAGAALGPRLAGVVARGGRGRPNTGVRS